MAGTESLKSLSSFSGGRRRFRGGGEDEINAAKAALDEVTKALIEKESCDGEAFAAVKAAQLALAEAEAAVAAPAPAAPAGDAAPATPAGGRRRSRRRSSSSSSSSSSSRRRRSARRSRRR